MALAHDHLHMSLEEFFRLVERNPEIHYEYLDGSVYMMTGGTARQALLGSNLN
jgi:Uma2 family endonuclease